MILPTIEWRPSAWGGEIHIQLPGDLEASITWYSCVLLGGPDWYLLERPVFDWPAEIQDPALTGR